MPCPNFGLYPVAIACLQTLAKTKIHFRLQGTLTGAFFVWSGYFRMGAYKRDVIKMGAYIHGVLILCRCPFYDTHPDLVSCNNL